MLDIKKSVLLISVGGSSAPVVYSLNHQKPDYIIYFTSRDSRKIVRQEIEPQLDYRPLDHDMIVTDDEQDLLISVQVLLYRLPQLLAQWNLDYSAVQGDYTGGTKTMSAALVLGLSKTGCPFSYIGGSARDKENLGVVIDGREQMLYRKNPWEALAVEALYDIRLLFNRCRYRAVEDLAQRTAEQVEGSRVFFQGLQHVSAGLYKWDNFDYKRALNDLDRGLSLLSPFIQGHPDVALKDFFAQLTAGREQLRAVLDDTLLFKANPSKKERGLATTGDGRAFIFDLLANAVRRAEIEYKYDDAVARLYSVIEKIAKVHLLTVYGLDNSDLCLDKIPESLHSGLRDHYLNHFTGKVQIPLGRSYALLASLNDPLGHAYRESAVELEKVLGVRNMSLLAHGFAPVNSETYAKMLRIALQFAGIEQVALPTFPLLPAGINLL